MIIQNYCYTRSDKLDYRDFVIPDNLNGKCLSTVRSIVRQILALEVKEPVWVLYKTSDIVVWGVCCKNSCLSQKYNVDEMGRAVYGFFSIVISDFSLHDLCVPYDLSFFKKLYENEVSPNWFRRQGEKFISSGGVTFHGPYHLINAFENDSIHLLNTDIFRCKRLGEPNIEEMIASSLTIDSITLSIGYDATENLSNGNALFMNSIVLGKPERIIPVKQACPSCGEYVSRFTSIGICDDCAKKNEVKSTPYYTANDEEMKQKDYELAELQRQLHNCQLEIEEKNKTIKKQNRLIAILRIVCGLLLLLSIWLFENSDIQIKNFFKSIRPAFQQISYDAQQDPVSFLEVGSQKVEFLAEGQDSVLLGWWTNSCEDKKKSMT